MNSLDPPRVLLFTTTLGYGGSEADFVRLAKYLAKRMPVSVVLMARDYGSTDYSNAQSEINLPIIILADGKHKSPSFLAKGLRWWAMLCHLRRLKCHHDVTISFLSGANLLNALAGRKFPSIVSERGSKLHHVGIMPRAKWLWLCILDPLTYRLAWRVVPVSIAYSAEITAIAGPRLAHKITPIEGSIDAALLVEKTEAPVDADIEAFCAKPTLVYCGRLDKGKGIDLLLPVFSNIKRQFPETRLLIIGDGPLQSTLLDYCREVGLIVTERGEPSADVFLAGYRADPIRHFRLCRLFCFPSLHEGLPNALIEGVASGIAVLSADCPYGPRSILSGEDEQPHQSDLLPIRLKYGTLLPMLNSPDSAIVWQNAICSELASPSLRKTKIECLGAISRFDIANTGKNWISLIEQAAQK